MAEWNERATGRKPLELKPGMSKDAMEEAAAFDGSKRSPNMPPKDAGTLIILDNSGSKPRVLMGKRHMGHTFMPGLFVFPGGRVDKADGNARVASELHPVVEAKLVNNFRGKPTKRRARAVALATIRETYEEAGLLVGQKGAVSQDHKDWEAFQTHNVAPSLDPLRLVARAITPPGRTRRFDAWFFATFADHVAHELPTGPSGELENLHWLTIDEARKLELPVITVSVLQELEDRLAADPKLKPTTDVPFFHLRGKTFLRDLI